MILSARLLLRCSLPGVIRAFQRAIVFCFSHRVSLSLGPRFESSFRSRCLQLFSDIEQPVQLLSDLDPNTVELQIVASSSRPVLNDSSGYTSHAASKSSR